MEVASAAYQVSLSSKNLWKLFKKTSISKRSPDHAITLTLSVVQVLEGETSLKPSRLHAYQFDRIIAIMLGRLEMSVEDCIKTYRSFAERAFTPKRRILSLPASPNGAYSALALEIAMKDVVKTQCRNINCTNLQTCTHGDEPFQDDSCVKTYVV